MSFQTIHKNLVIQGLIPQYKQSLVPVIYLGMPPLPLKGVKYANTVSLSGVSDGGASVVNVTSGTESNKGFHFGNGKKPRKARGVSTVGAKSNNGNTKKRKVPKARKAKKILLKDKNGRFIKKGG